MVEVSIVEQVRCLVGLQVIDVEIFALKKDLEEKPQYLKKLEQEFEGKKTHLKSLEDKFKAIQVSRKTQEVELQAKDEAIVKANAQLSQIKTNKEYTAKLTEIESIKADKSIIEEKILLAYDEGDGIKVEIDKEKQVLAEEERKFLNEQKKIDDDIAYIRERIKTLETQRAQAVPHVQKDLLKKYERILYNKEGLAIVPVTGSACGGCFMNVPAQVINEIKMHDKLIYCEMCARILYLEEDVV